MIRPSVSPRRVDNYVTHRPRYPAEVITILRDECGLLPDSIVADIGAGTGILTDLFLQNGNHVFAVEPNCQMREAAERLLGNRTRFHSVVARAEATTLARQSVEYVVAGQAFHWFDRNLARTEFIRILKPAGWVVLIWNDRLTEAGPFLDAYERLLERYSTDYARVNHRHVNEGVLADFFRPGGFKSTRLTNRQDFDYAGLQGRLLSSSYAPQRGDSNHEPMLAELAHIFQKYQREGHVEFEYTTKIYYGRLT